MVELIKKALRFYVRLRWGIKAPYMSKRIVESFISDYRQRKLPWLEIWSIHHKGFTVSNWIILKLNKSNYKEYLSDIQYFRMHPINGEYSYIIDDKWTLKKLCADTELNKYMPEYYYRVGSNGMVEQLMDCPYINENGTAKAISKLLREKGTLAIKQVAGSLGIGFYKAEFKSGKYLLNEREYSEEEFCNEISKLRDYLITEYLFPHSTLAQFCPYTCNCLRYLAGRTDGKLQMLKSFIRFGTEKSGFVENYNAGGVLCYIDENGCFENGNVIDFESGTNQAINKHPDNGKTLKGKIPEWEEIIAAADKFGKVFPGLMYMGIDFVVTSDERVKVLEINSLTSLDSIQLDSSILDTNAGDFYRELMK